MRLSNGADFKRVIDKVIDRNIDYLREKNDGEADIEQLRQRQGAILALKDIAKFILGSRDAYEGAGKQS
jgi:hypothetical protein